MINAAIKRSSNSSLPVELPPPPAADLSQSVLLADMTGVNLSVEEVQDQLEAELEESQELGVQLLQPTPEQLGLDVSRPFDELCGEVLDVINEPPFDNQRVIPGDEWEPQVSSSSSSHASVQSLVMQ